VGGGGEKPILLTRGGGRKVKEDTLKKKKGKGIKKSISEKGSEFGQRSNLGWGPSREVY